MTETRVVGHSVTKVDGPGLVAGTARYVDDYVVPGTLEIKCLWSPHAHARIVRIDTSKAEAMPGVRAVLTHENVPRIPHTTAGQGYPEPSPYDTFIFDRKVRFVGDRVAAVAAETAEIAEAAIHLIEVEYEVLPAVFDPKEALESPITIHDEEEATIPIPVTYDPSRNLVSEVKVEIGDLDAALKRSDVTVDREYVTQYAQHCPIETHKCFGYPDEQGRTVLVTSTQVPFHVRRIVAQALGVPVKSIRVIKPRIGGGFGAKQEIVTEDVVALMVMRTGRPCRWALTRAEEFVSSRTRHPMYVRVRLGAMADGRMTGIGIDVVMNTGAYGSHGLTVSSNAGSKVIPLYNKVESIHFLARTAYTNLPVGGAYRGYGATQSYFAVESAMDELAERLGIDPVELRRINHIQSGETSPIFAILGEGKAGMAQRIGSCGARECLDRGAEAIGWETKRRTLGWANRIGTTARGVGMCLLMQGSSIPGIDMGAAFVKLNDDGSFNLLVGATDLGTGSDTVMAQIAAEVLGVRVSDVLVYSSDTDMTPFDVGAYASSTTYLSGEAVRKAAEDAAEKIKAVAAKLIGQGTTPADVVLEDRKARAPAGEVSLDRLAKYVLYEEDQFQVMGTASHVTKKSPPPFNAQFAEVEVDLETGFVRVVDYVSAIDCGTPIHPKLAEGQMEGAVLNGISYALTEGYRFTSNGAMTNPSFGKYRIFTTADKVPVRTILVPTYEETGPYGAKSVSEVGINGPQAAIANAIYHATGVRLTAPPFTPEKVLEGLRALGRAA